MDEKPCCDNCKHVNRAKGYGMGNYDYWCHKQNGQKRATHCCPLYEKEDE